MLLVFFGHYAGFTPGIAGVEIFFVLSGFLITGLLFDAQRKPHRFRDFYARRSLRIFPLYYAVWLAFLLLTPLLRIQWRPLNLLWPVYLGNYIGLLAHLHPRLAGPVPLHMVYLLGSVDGHPRVLFVGHFWSLCVEEQFYLLWPLVVFRVRDRLTLMRLCALVFMLSPLVRMGVMALIPSVLRGDLNPITPLSLDGFLLGGLGALLLRGPMAEKVRRAGPYLLLAALAFLLFPLASQRWLHTGGSLPLLINVHWLLSYGFSMMQLCSLGLILTCLNKGSWFTRVLALAPLRGLGRISYGFYVFHDIPHPIYLHVGKLLHWPFACTLGLAFVATLVISSLSYFLLERPFLRLKTRFEG